MWRFGRRIHVSWLIGWCGLSIVFGVFVAPHLSLRLIDIGWLLLGLTLLVVSMIAGRRWFLVLIIIGGLLVGLWRAGNEIANLERYDELVDVLVTIKGLVDEDPVRDENGMRIVLSSIEIEGQSYPGTIYATTSSQAVVMRGDRMVIAGKVDDGFGSYSAAMYRAELVRVDPTHDAIVEMRDWFGNQVRQVIKEPAASLGMGFLVGEKSSLPSDLSDALQVAGLTHVVVASGYNLTILVRLGRRLFMRVSKFSATLVALLLILGFIGLTGLSPSMTRAGMVALLSLAAWYYGRRFHPFVLLSIVAVISVLIKPNYVWNDVGWALSFAAFIGVMILAPLLQRYFFGDKKPSVIRQIMGETVAAHLLTMPIIILVFSQLSHVAIISNLLVLPFVPIAMLLTFVTGIMSTIVMPVALMIGWLSEKLLDYMIAVIYFSSQLSWAKTDMSVSVWLTVAAYAVIAGIMIYLWRRTKLDLREANIVV